MRGAESQQSGSKEDSKGCLEAAVAEQNTFSLYMYPVWLGAATALDLSYPVWEPLAISGF